jgi:hypothetical protein
MSLAENVNAAWSPATRELLEQLAARQRDERRRAQPVAMIGPRDADARQKESAYRIARSLAQAGVPLLCGGKNGGMEAAARGAQDGGGIVVGLLPEADTSGANPYLTVAIPTGMGITRNSLIAHGAVCLVAVGGGLGTLSEIALGAQLGKPVFAMLNAPKVAGVQYFDEAEDLVVGVARCLLSVQPTD